jgi:hypothetical protein
LFVKPAIHLHLLVSLKVHGALPPLCHMSLGVILNLSPKKCMECYLCCATCLCETLNLSQKNACFVTSAVPHVCVKHSICHRKILTFFSLIYFFTRSINIVPIHTVPLHLVCHILGKMYIKIPYPYGGYAHQQKIFQQISCPLMIEDLDSDF